MPAKKSRAIFAPVTAGICFESEPNIYYTIFGPDVCKKQPEQKKTIFMQTFSSVIAQNMSENVQLANAIFSEALPGF